MDKCVLDLYTNYLINSYGQTTAIGLSSLRGAHLSHGRISRFLKAQEFTAAYLWQRIKSLVRQAQCDDGVLILDNSIEEKRYSEESELLLH